MSKKIKDNYIDAWALVEDGRLCHYYALAYITFTKQQAEVERDIHNAEPLNHKMHIEKVRIMFSRTPKKLIKKEDG